MLQVSGLAPLSGDLSTHRLRQWVVGYAQRVNNLFWTGLKSQYLIRTALSNAFFLFSLPLIRYTESIDFVQTSGNPIHTDVTAPNSRTPKTITLNDVARDVGVSRSTVSLVLRNSPLVADETRSRVLASIQRLGYVYNRGAASLRSQQSKTIGLVVTDITNPFFAELTIGVEEGLEEAQYTAFLGNTSDTLRKQITLLERMQEHRPDGILLCPTAGTTLEQIRRIQHQTPLVFFVRYLPDLGFKNFDYVGVDNVQGAAIATAHLLAHGHTRIAFIGGSADSSARRDRMLGYSNQMKAAGLAIDDRLFVVGPVTREAGRQAVLHLLERPDPPTAALCYNDVVAFGVQLGLQASGRRTGQDFAIVGFDDISEAALWQPALTTVALEPRRLGRLAAQLLLDRIEQPDAPVRQIVFACRLVVRDSCGGPLSAL